MLVARGLLSAGLPLLAAMSLATQSGVANASRPAPARHGQVSTATAASLLLAESPRKPFLVVIDPAHGGVDLGSRFGATAHEKDVTLAFARRLRGELQTQKVSVLLLRDSDVHMTAEQRAVAANTAQPAIFISVHAALPGGGVRIYTAMLPPLPSTQTHTKANFFLAWESAQSGALARSRELATEVRDAIHNEQVEASVQSAPLPPLNAVLAPAIAIELSPSAPAKNRTKGTAEEFIQPDLQRSVVRAITAVITAQRPPEEAQ